jgi:peroxiredoxin
MTLLKSNIIHPGNEIIPFELKGIDERIYTERDFEDKDVLVLIFMCNHCPYVKAQIKRYIDFQDKHRERGIQLVAINSNDPEYYSEDSFENMKKFAEERKMNFPYLVDESQETARNYDAVCTPDIYVYDKERKLRYRGRFDDNWKEEDKVSSRDLEKAVEKILNEEEINFKQIPSMGCSIKWRN